MDAQGVKIKDRLTDGKKIWLYEARGGGAYQVDSSGYHKNLEYAIPFEDDKRVDDLSEVLTSMLKEKFAEENVELQLFKSKTMVFVRFRLLNNEKIPAILDYLKQQSVDKGITLPAETGPFIDTKPFSGDLNGNKGIDNLYHAWFVSTTKATTIEGRIIPKFL